jgi:hypothetical protein
MRKPLSLFLGKQNLKILIPVKSLFRDSAYSVNVRANYFCENDPVRFTRKPEIIFWFKTS